MSCRLLFNNTTHNHTNKHKHASHPLPLPSNLAIISSKKPCHNLATISTQQSCHNLEQKTMPQSRPNSQATNSTEQSCHNLDPKFDRSNHLPLLCLELIVLVLYRAPTNPVAKFFIWDGLVSCVLPSFAPLPPYLVRDNSSQARMDLFPCATCVAGFG